MKSSAPKNVANPSLYAKAKAKAKAKFDVYPSAYANAYMVKEYKRMGGKYKGATGGEVSLDPKKSDLDNDGKSSSVAGLALGNTPRTASSPRISHPALARSSSTGTPWDLSTARSISRVSAAP